MPAQGRDAAEEILERPIRLNDTRMDAVVAALQASGAKSVADLGCGEGKLLSRLVRERGLDRLVGVDASSRALEHAKARLKLDQPGGPREGRVSLLHSALTYRDRRWAGTDAVTLVEVIEHLDPDRLPALARVVFGEAQPGIAIVTTPNAEYNALFAGMAAGALRHPDHRFEWTRAEFDAWAQATASAHGYAVTLSAIGEADPAHGAPTQMAVFRR
jgi:3' terminal RNA ribose 2'-O-methyltransferase Hen1